MSLKKRLLKLLKGKKGNALLLATAGAIAATFSVYFFISLTTLSADSKQRVAHLYNAYQMGISINALLKNRIFTKGQLQVSYQDETGENRFTKEDFEKYVQMEPDSVFRLLDLVNDEILLDSRDPTMSRLKSAPTSYDREKTTIKVVFDMVIDHYNEHGDAMKKVVGVKYFVNLAGQSVPASSKLGNAPYEAGEPFYYLVSYADEDAGLTHNDITLQDSGVMFDGVLDTQTFGVGPQASRVIILPGEDEADE